jgi:hypothetical protein
MTMTDPVPTYEKCWPPDVAINCGCGTGHSMMFMEFNEACKCDGCGQLWILTIIPVGTFWIDPEEDAAK